MAAEEREAVFEPAAVPRYGIIATPIGTLEEVRQNGMDPENVACCHQRAAGIRGCPMWESCRFGEVKRGGWKGQGPHYVGYYLETSPSDGARQVENFMACYNYTRVLQHREIAGRAHKDQGKPHETIQIIAQEGETIYLERHKHLDADGGNKNGDIRIKTWTEPMQVPRFPRPGENPAITHRQVIAQRAAQRAAAEESDDLARFSRVRAALAQDVGVEKIEGEETLEMDITPPAKGKS